MSLDQQMNQAAKSFSVGFRQKIAVTFTLLIVFIMLITVYLVTIQIKHASLGRAENSGRLLGRMIALSMGEDIVRGNFQGIDYALKEFVKLKKIEYCLILDNHGRIISSTHPNSHGKYFSDAWSRTAMFSGDLSIRRARSGNTPVYDTSVPIVIGGQRYGMIRAGFTIDDEYDHIKNLLIYNLSLGLVLIIIGVFIAYGLSSTILAPLNSILRSIESISHGDYSTRTAIKSADELGELSSSFNRLATILHDREVTSNFITRKIFDQNPELAGRNPSGTRIEAVILHLELHRFNNFIDRTSPEESIETLNRFFSQTTEIIANAYGLIDKLGEGYITAIFPINRNDAWPAPLRAGFAALAARDNMNRFNFKAARLGLEEINMRAGLSHGEIVIGHIGTRSRSDFSAIGPRIASAREAGKQSNRRDNYRPVGDQSYASVARDYLTMSVMGHDNESRDNETDYFTLTGFTNLSYFSEKLKSASQRGAISIIQAYGLTETPDGLACLKKLISSPDFTYRKEAIRSMSPFMFQQNSEAKEFLIELVKSTAIPGLKSVAVSILGLCRDKQLASFFAELFTDTDDRVRANAIEAYIPLEAGDKKERLKQLLDDKAPRVCANALLGLWLADDQQTLNCLYELLKSDSSGKRASAAFAVYFLAVSRKFRRLFPGHSEHSGMTTLPIIENIFKRLMAMLESRETSERFQALRALGRVGDPTNCRQKLIELLKDETDPETINCAHTIVSDWDKISGQAQKGVRPFTIA